MELERHEGKILRINEAGLGIVEDQESNRQFAFTFDKISGYRGEKPREVGLVVGAHVSFKTTADSQVTSVEVIKR